MDDRELEQLLHDIESDRVERKESMSDKDRIAQAICAFANDLPNHGLPGVVFVGARDNGSCANLEITDRLLQALGAMRSDGNILPLPTITVQKRTLGGCDLAVVIVQPSYAPPVRFRGLTWIRVGPRRAIATIEEERRLIEKRRARDLPFDLCPFPSSNLHDLDTDLFSRVYLPSEQSHEVLERNSRSLEQQLARNAIMHRDYELSNAPVRVYWFNDRIEIHNPGGPYGQVNRQNFGSPGITDYRNPSLSAAMKSLGFVQRFGIGIDLARKELAKNGNPPPEFQVEDAHICVIMRRVQ